MNNLSAAPLGRAVGVQYVKGTPPQTPVLRPLRQPIYDSEIYPAAGVRELNVFVNNNTFAATGAPKSEVDTNMTQGGRLGTPLEFDLVGFTMEYDRNISVGDHQTLYDNGVFIWIFGQNTNWLQVPDTKIPQGIGPQAAIDGNAGPTALVANGWGVTTNFYNFSDVLKEPRRITSNESFRNRKLWPAAPLVSVNRRLRVYMLGVLYTQL